jgi:hypothetical protein
MKRSLVLHPFFFGLFPVVSLFTGNMGEAELVDALPVVAVTLALISTVLCICQLMLRDIQRAGLITSGFVLFFFAPFHVFLTLRSWLSDLYGHAVQLSIVPIYVALSFLIILYIYFFAKKATELQHLNLIFNIISVCLVGIPASTIAIAKSSERVDWPNIHKRQQAEALISKITAIPQLPDIYYIIMDRYAGPETLKTIYNFDNQDFLNYLGTRGFYVAAKSAANYPTTAQSLASSLNLQYINYLKEFVDEKSTSWIPVQSLLQDHKVGQFLKSKGYHYVHLGSWWEPTRKNKLADENVYFTRLPEMFYALYGTTMFRPVSTTLRVLDLHYEHWRGNRRQFENLTRTVHVQGPKFVFAHFLLPHPPYVFGRDGEYLPADRTSEQPDKISYVNQLVYTNRMLQKTINELLSKSKQPPIIILQADEGPWPRDYENFDWQRATYAELNQKMKILNSLYLPGVESRVLYPTISPVNTFRVIFNLYFGTNLLLLRDESFVFQKHRHPYNLLNITSRLDGYSSLDAGDLSVPPSTGAR